MSECQLQLPVVTGTECSCGSAECMSASCEMIRAEIGSANLERVRDQGDVVCSLAGHHTLLQRPSPRKMAKAFVATPRGAGYF